ncbi:dUTP diphosphatase [Pseudomonas sp. PAMC 29040]|uniref:dUTP diphosphatase n=1 Tax=Pseudomonas sp. PAMC 29040 TaxID=2498450 RepID=UPI000FB2839B|nr:dUTP diphosphatase [Pseudomonas sp. PAMC 29040]RUT30877.1 dUTP diphosphatase [Pseudomonas sp. PAMC 29040]
MNIKRIGSHTLPLPVRAKARDFGYDLRAAVAVTLEPGKRVTIPTGFAYEFLNDQGAQIWPRSGLAEQYGIDTLAGLVDGGYQGEAKVILINHGDETVSFLAGDRIAQLVIITRVSPSFYSAEMVEVEAFTTDSDRGVAGLGHTGMA